MNKYVISVHRTLEDATDDNVAKLINSLSSANTGHCYRHLHSPVDTGDWIAPITFSWSVDDCTDPAALLLIDWGGESRSKASALTTFCLEAAHPVHRDAVTGRWVERGLLALDECEQTFRVADLLWALQSQDSKALYSYTARYPNDRHGCIFGFALSTDTLNWLSAIAGAP